MLTIIKITDLEQMESSAILMPWNVSKEKTSKLQKTNT